MSRLNNEEKCKSKKATGLGSTQLSFTDWKMQKCSKSGASQKQDKPVVQITTNDRNFNKPTLPTFANQTTQNIYGKDFPVLFGRPPPHFSSENLNCRGAVVEFPSQVFDDAISLIGNNFRHGNFNAHLSNGCNLNWKQPSSRVHYQHNNTVNTNLSRPDNHYPVHGVFQQQHMQQVHSSCNIRNGSNNQIRGNIAIRKLNLSGITSFNRNEKCANASLNSKTMHQSEPNIFIRNRNDNKKPPFIPMPNFPDLETSLNSEERKKQWRDYREAMKPFKNKDFYNAKRVVQRLGKKDLSELDEKQQFRLENAVQKISEYKQKLAEKSDHYVKSVNKSSSDTGEIFVLKKHNIKNTFVGKGNINKQRSAAGMKFVGGPSKFDSFVHGGVLGKTYAKNI